MNGYDSYKTWLGEDQEPGPHLVRGGSNWANFIECVRSGKKENLNAPTEEGHIPSALVHLANVSYRLGQSGRGAQAGHPALYHVARPDRLCGVLSARLACRDARK